MSNSKNRANNLLDFSLPCAQTETLQEFEGKGQYCLLLTLNFMLIALKSHLYNIGSKAAFNLREPERAEAAKRPSLRVAQNGVKHIAFFDGKMIHNFSVEVTMFFISR